MSNPNALDYLRRSDALTKLREGWTRTDIYESWVHTAIGMRKQDALRLLRELAGVAQASGPLRETPADEMVDVDAFPLYTGKMRHRYFVDATIQRVNSFTGQSESVQRRVWFDNPLSRNELDDMMGLVGEGEDEGDYHRVVSFTYTASARGW